MENNEELLSQLGKLKEKCPLIHSNLEEFLKSSAKLRGGLVCYDFAGYLLGRQVTFFSKIGEAWEESKRMRVGDLVVFVEVIYPIHFGVYVGGGKYLSKLGAGRVSIDNFTGMKKHYPTITHKMALRLKKGVVALKTEFKTYENGGESLKSSAATDREYLSSGASIPELYSYWKSFEITIDGYLGKERETVEKKTN